MLTASSVLSAPVLLWDLYVEHLWRYEPGSWVEWTASCFRALAFALIAPFAILTLLDIASYVIARTLGVVDATKASTGGVVVVPVAGAEPEPSHLELATAAVHVQTGEPSDVPERGEPGETALSESSATPSYFFKDTVVEESDMKLSGAEAFSPFPSQPPSPSPSRRDLVAHLRHQTLLQPMTEIEARMGRERSGTASSDTSRSGESHFAAIDRDSGSEGEGVQIRRRRGQKKSEDGERS